ncbi:MAG: hypothetical protein J0I25_09260, partial [Sphingomonadales bacterium]|nr:hypothetical protein [Sphingomonadales bacterium]
CAEASPVPEAPPVTITPVAGRFNLGVTYRPFDLTAWRHRPAPPVTPALSRGPLCLRLNRKSLLFRACLPMDPGSRPG